MPALAHASPAPQSMIKSATFDVIPSGLRVNASAATI
jgi:hypothetical protein